MMPSETALKVGAEDAKKLRQKYCRQGRLRESLPGCHGSEEERGGGRIVFPDQ